jgi:hypothetical protein
MSCYVICTLIRKCNNGICTLMSNLIQILNLRKIQMTYFNGIDVVMLYLYDISMFSQLLYTWVINPVTIAK